ncbi:MAG: ABC transporter permease [Chloroflexi bacterium]|nr:ABC transporter permease [Chloroflexota bacterium]
MPSLPAFLFRRFIYILVTLLLSTIVLYGVVATFPPETRAMLYFPKNPGKNFNPNSEAVIINDIIQRYRLNDPFPVQYVRWLGNLLRGDWGWSATANAEVLPSLLRLTPATAELTFYSVLLFIPLGILGGVIAGMHSGRLPDHGFRLAAFLATSIPPFILAILLMAFFYVGVHWFPPGRLTDSLRWFVNSDQFTQYTGFITIDGLLNGRVDITLDAFRHLVLPVITLSAYHWATLGRITRATMIDELGKDYITAALARGASYRRATWYHALRNAVVPALNSSLLSAASLVTGVYIVETIFAFPGISRFIVGALSIVPDVPAALGFSVYTIILTLLFMTALDLLQALADPRHREVEALS